MTTNDRIRMMKEIEILALEVRSQMLEAKNLKHLRYVIERFLEENENLLVGEGYAGEIDEIFVLDSNDRVFFVKALVYDLENGKYWHIAEVPVSAFEEFVREKFPKIYHSWGQQ